MLGGINLYAYAGLNPVNFTDRHGLDYTVSQTGGTITIFAAVTIYGPHANDPLAKKWEQGINDYWNNFEKNFSYGKKCDVKFDIEVQSDPMHNWWFTAKKEKKGSGFKY